MLARDYRQILRDYYEERRRQNPRFNMSSLAKELSVSPSRLSELFSGKQGLSRSVGRRFADKMGLNSQEAELFCDLIEFEHARSQQARNLAKIRLESRTTNNQGRSLQLEAFQVVSDWYHFAIVQLLELPSFREDPHWIASALNILPAQSSAAIERLLKLEIVERDESGKLRATNEFIATPDGIPSEAIRKFHSQVLDLAKKAQIEQPATKRAYSANFVTIRREDVEKVRERLKRFRRRLLKEIEPKAIAKDAVYCLSMQFFELTDSENL